MAVWYADGTGQCFIQSPDGLTDQTPGLWDGEIDLTGGEGTQFSAKIVSLHNFCERGNFDVV